ncbi:P-loop containing nucleoside triphosphate hydrolase protein, partial [Macrolepiota fuliginosa MF-IS2]
MDFRQLRQMPATITTHGSLKCKAIPEEDKEDELDAELTLHTKPLTQPHTPVLSQPCPTRRGTSAPPTCSPGVTATAKHSGAAGRNPPGQTTSGSFSGGGPQNKWFTSINSAHATDAAQPKTDMASKHNKVAALQANHAQLSQDLMAACTQELNQHHELVDFSDKVDVLKKKHAKEVMDLERDVKKWDWELREVKEDLALARGDLEQERGHRRQSTAHMALKAQVQAMQAQNSLLQNQNNNFAHTVAEYQLQLKSNKKKIAELKNKILESEIMWQKLHNMVQELKGNIQVFCHVPEDVASAAAQISFPEASKMQKQITLTSFSKSAMGQEWHKTYSFTFDCVFTPDTTQSEVFEEISLLAQSCMDGYNVCIFAYGQTGSGKLFMMEGAQGLLAGMIPCAVEQVFHVMAEMKFKGWEYTIKGQFLEIYNEMINDLLARGALDNKKKHEIKHNPKTGATCVTNITVVPLCSTSQVQSLLTLAHSWRSVAATLMNECSSHSHSVFMLRIAGVHVGLSSSSTSGSIGENGECGLVGLPDKEQVKETQNINKSLSVLGD